MAWYNSLNDLRGDIGHVASNPVVAGLAGATLGPAAAAGISALGKAITPGANIGDIAKSGVVGYGAGKVGSVLRDALGNVIGHAGGGGSVPAVGAPSSSGVLGTLGNAAGTIAGLGSSAISGLSSMTGGINPAILALAGAQGVNAATLGAKANELSDTSLKYATDAYGERAPLRTAGLAGLLNPTPRNTTELTALRKGTPMTVAGLPVTPPAPVQNGGALSVRRYA